MDIIFNVWIQNIHFIFSIYLRGMCVWRFYRKTKQKKKAYNIYKFIIAEYDDVVMNIM